jgi:cytochrome c6
MKRLVVALAVLAFASVAAAADGAAIYKSKCAVCHGPDGKGQNPMGKKLGVQDLAASKMSEAEIVKIVNEGKKGEKGAMTPFKGRLTDEEIAAVAKYVKEGVK